MTAIKHTLQREVFLPSEERLISVVHVTKEGKKKKACFLCAAVTTEKPVQASLYQVKKAEKEREGFKKKMSWALRQLKLFDAKYINKDVPEFELHFDKVYKWVASSIAEKNAFILSLWKLSQMYLVQKIEFSNLQPSILEEIVGSAGESGQATQQSEEMGALTADSDWHALSQKEETDLDTIMSQCEFAISNAEKFADQLSRDLSVLDGANIHSIMGSEDQVLELMVLLDTGFQQANKIEEKLTEYERKLQGIKDLMEGMKDKEALIHICNTNQERLLLELEKLVSLLDLDHSHIRALLEADLSSPKGIQECTKAATALLKCMSAEIHPSLDRMAAVTDQRKRFAHIKSTFAKRLAHHLNNLFIHQGNELGGGTFTVYSQELKLPQHTSCHRELRPYADLMNWLKIVDNDSFVKLRKVYTNNLNKLYDKEIKDFMENVKQQMYHPRSDRKGSGVGIGTSHQLTRTPSARQSPSASSLNRSGSQKTGSQTTLDKEEQSGDVTGSKFDMMYEYVLSELGPWCLAEQDFCVRFFNLTAGTDDDSPQAGAGVESPDSLWVKDVTRTPSPKQRQINEEVRKMMGELFPSLEQELTNFEVFGIQINTTNSLYMLVRMGSHVLKAEDTRSFLSKAFANCLVQIKRNFDRHVQAQVHAVHDYKPAKKSKIGIIPFVTNFEEFARQAEAIFRGSERRADLDKAYQKLVAAIFSEISRVANESQKTPREVVLFENYHHIFAMLSELKIASLEGQKKEAKQGYQEQLQAYVTSYLGQPLEKVHAFFVGIESKVAAGVRVEEVGYQLQFSKQELRKVVKEYSGREVKKGLEHLYKKVEKHLCEEENLLQVVWHSMQDEFIKQIKYFESMISKCYPDSGITFEFTIDNLLGYFSDIAQLH